MCVFTCFFFNDTATTEIYTLSLHDALPISANLAWKSRPCSTPRRCQPVRFAPATNCPSRSASSATICPEKPTAPSEPRSEEHTSELQSRQYLVCRLLLEKKEVYDRKTLDRS